MPHRSGIEIIGMIESPCSNRPRRTSALSFRRYPLLRWPNARPTLLAVSAIQAIPLGN